MTEHRTSWNRPASADGILGIAILFLLVGHIDHTAGVPVSLPLWGTLGITMLFVVTGFITTTRLVDELNRTGRILLGRFYARLAMRLLPITFVFAIVVAVLVRRLAIDLRPGDALAAITYTMNFHVGRAWWLGHLWALGVQAQFLLVWPVVVAAFGARVALWVAVGTIAASPVLRIVALYGAPSLRPLIDQAFPFVVDAVAMGCALALARERLWEEKRYRGILESPAVALIPLFVLVAYVATRDGRPSAGASLLVGWTAVNAGVAVCLDWLLRFPRSRVERAVGARPLVWLGMTSYSLYLWQQLFLNRHHVAWFTRFPTSLALSVGTGLASYYLVERPCLRLRTTLIPAQETR